MANALCPTGWGQRFPNRKNILSLIKNEKSGRLANAYSSVCVCVAGGAPAVSSLQSRHPLPYPARTKCWSLSRKAWGASIFRIRAEPHLMCRHEVQGCLTVRDGRGADGGIGKTRLETSPGKPPLSKSWLPEPAEFSRESHHCFVRTETWPSHLPSRNFRRGLYSIDVLE